MGRNPQSAMLSPMSISATARRCRTERHRHRSSHRRPSQRNCLRMECPTHTPGQRSSVDGSLTARRGVTFVRTANSKLELHPTLEPTARRVLWRPDTLLPWARTSLGSFTEFSIRAQEHQPDRLPKSQGRRHKFALTAAGFVGVDVGTGGPSEVARMLEAENQPVPPRWLRQVTSCWADGS